MKIRKYTLGNLLKTVPVLSETELAMFFGGGDGSLNNPYTEAEFNAMCDNGTWTGGYVGDTYMLGQVFSYGSSNYHVYSNYEDYLLANDPEAYFSRQFSFMNSYSSFWTEYPSQSSYNAYGTSWEDIRANTISTIDVISTMGGKLGDNAERILDDRGKYMAQGAIYKLDREITVRFHFGNVSTTTKVLNVVRVGGRWMGIIGNVTNLVDAYIDYQNDDYESALEKLIDFAIGFGLAYIPCVGWACAIGYTIYNEEIKEFVSDIF